MYKVLTLFFVINILVFGQITPPSGVAALSYEKHVDVIWNLNSESDLAGYKIYKWNGSGYTLYSVISEKRQWFTEWYGATGVQGIYKVSAYDVNNNESSLSDSVVALTKDMSNDEFLDMVERATFRYFYDYAHSVSGLARERLGSGNTVTSGGSGFGIMGLLVGVERNYITRDQGVERMSKILSFLLTKAQRYHGAFAHWINGETGATIPFSTYDNGGDLVETSFLVQGLLTARQYFNGSDSSEIKIRNQINTIWTEVEWTWYRRASFSTFLYWHWSPNYNWQINMKLTGWSETMIAYLLAIASPTYKVNASMYYQGWASSSSYVNGNTYYGHKLWVGANYGGPLFFTHYSFLGFDPRNKKDNYTNYFFNNRNQTLINRDYCIANPKGFLGYSNNSWGLTASDNPWGYSAQEPYVNDNGTISPTAALSSTPYTPTESVEALKHFYRSYGNSLWGQYGFKDAYNLSQNWFAGSYLAIDQGPILVMIENYRSQLLWNKFMSAPEIITMVDSIFVPDSTTSVAEHNKNTPDDFIIYGNYPNPFNPSTSIVFNLPVKSEVSVIIFNSLGQVTRDLIRGEMEKGKNTITWNGKDNSGNTSPSGVYFIQIKNKMNVLVHKAILQK